MRRAFWHLLRADFLERVRRYGFLVTLLFAAWLGYLVSIGAVRLWIGNTRGVYDSAWVGALTALVVNTFLSLAGFYVVKNTVERDRQTGVGQILASTPMSKPLYTLGKTASNLAIRRRAGCVFRRESGRRRARRSRRCRRCRST